MLHLTHEGIKIVVTGIYEEELRDGILQNTFLMAVGPTLNDIMPGKECGDAFAYKVVVDVGLVSPLYP